MIIISYLIRTRFCKTCNLKKPPKASHCKYCNNCVKNFDHHCFFIGNCIGERNRKAFFLFLIFGFLKALTGFLVSTFCIFKLISDNGTFYLKMLQKYFYLVMLIFLSLLIAYFAKKYEKHELSKKLIFLFFFITIFFLIILTNFTKFAYNEYMIVHGIIFMIYTFLLVIFSLHLKTQLILISLDMSLKGFLKVQFEDKKFKKLNYENLFKNLKQFLAKRIIKSDLI